MTGAAGLTLERAARLHWPLNAYAVAVLHAHGSIDSLHFGLFARGDEGPGEAQQAMTRALVEVLPDPPARLVEVGIGFGGLGRLLVAMGHDWRGITPDAAQAAVAEAADPALAGRISVCRLEEYPGPKARADAVLFQESAQYFRPDALLDAAVPLLAPAGRIAILDEFAAGRLEALEDGATARGLGIAALDDVTPAAAPSVAMMLEILEDHEREVRAACTPEPGAFESLVASWRRIDGEYASGSRRYLRLVLARR